MREWTIPTTISNRSEIINRALDSTYYTHAGQKYSARPSTVTDAARRNLHLTGYRATYADDYPETEQATSYLCKDTTKRINRSVRVMRVIYL